MCELHPAGRAETQRSPIAASTLSIKEADVFAINDLKHAYGGREVLRIEAWSAPQGEHWLMLGQSGSGKTTLLHIIAGILRPTTGSASVAGQDLSALSAAELDRFRGRNIGIVLQRLHLLPSLTVAQNVQLAQYLAGLPQDADRVHEVLAGLDMADKADARPHALSHGQAQRAAIARAVVNKPRLLLADEPTSNLDDARCAQALDLLLTQAAACGATLVIATHDQRVKARVSNHFLLGVAQ
jgi:putative ABC transport system ATP-binding protein